MTSKKITKNNTELLYGQINKEQLYFDYPVWLEQENVYKPNEEELKNIQGYDKDINIYIFLGTWCGDSRRNVPKFFKAIKGNSHFKTILWAVDRKKKLDNDLIEKYNIKRVPTFIFEKDGVELGRIIENPKKTIEADIQDILLLKK
ncbi:MAG: thioredoxin [Calditrichaeota bacterium]|nr:thioredoxin [Calditrichota bacterium]